MKDKNRESNPVYNRKILRNWMKHRFRTNKISKVWKDRNYIIPKHLR